MERHDLDLLRAELFISNDLPEPTEGFRGWIETTLRGVTSGPYPVSQRSVEIFRTYYGFDGEPESYATIVDRFPLYRSEYSVRMDCERVKDRVESSLQCWIRQNGHDVVLDVSRQRYVDELELSARSYNALKNANIELSEIPWRFLHCF